MNLKRSSPIGALAFVFTFATLVCGSHVAAQAVTPQAPKSGSAAKPAVSHGNPHAADDINQAWRNLARSYQDLTSVSPDVKGDTSRLEAAIAAAINDLHQLDSSFAAATPALGRKDVGDSREVIFRAVQQHLVLAKKFIEQSGIKSKHCEQALAHIATAQTELNAAVSAPVKK